MTFPIGGADFVANQAVGGIRVGNAQQGFGKAHEHHALLAGKFVFVHEGVETAVADALFAYRDDEIAGGCGNPVKRRSVDAHRVEQHVYAAGLVGAIPGRHGLPQGIPLGHRLAEDHGARLDPGASPRV
jgi:hypothetical protein